MNHLFAYGTLMCADIMQSVTGSLPPAVRGMTRGFIRLKVRGEHFPAMIKNIGSSVEGIVYLNVPASTWHLLDQFEGEMYERLPVMVSSEQGGLLQAYTYVWKSDFMSKLEPTDWDYTVFLQTGKKEFLEHYQGFRRK